MARTILCTIDFTPSSTYALKCAIALAKDLGAHLIILYTYRLTRDHKEEVFERKRRTEEQAVNNFSAIENDLLKTSGITYEFKTEIGFVADRVEALVRKTPIGFLVMDRNMTFETRESFEELLANMVIPTVIVPAAAP
jgi:hypothetical protein